MSFHHRAVRESLFHFSWLLIAPQASGVIPSSYRLLIFLLPARPMDFCVDILFSAF